MSRAGFDRRWRTVRIPAPVVATDWTIKAPGNAWWRITSLVARLVTDANAANRVITLRAGDQSTLWYAQETPLSVPANTTVDFCAHTGGGGTSATALTLVLALPSDGLLLPPGHQLQVATMAIQAGDQWSRIMAQVDEIPSDASYASNVGQVTESP